MRAISEIIVHCAATREDWWKSRSLAQKVREIRSWHVNGRGWSDIGYHYLIDRDGKVAEGRPITRNGAHTKGRNTGTIGVCLLGGHGSSSTDQFEANFTNEQDKALRSLILDLRNKYGRVPVNGHNQYANKACPGFHAPTWFARQPKPQAQPQFEAPKPQTWGLFAILAKLFGGKK